MFSSIKSKTRRKWSFDVMLNWSFEALEPEAKAHKEQREDTHKFTYPHTSPRTETLGKILLKVSEENKQRICCHSSQLKSNVLKYILLYLTLIIKFQMQKSNYNYQSHYI